MSNQNLPVVTYVENRTQEFYNDFFLSKTPLWFTERIKTVKVRCGVDQNKKQNFKSIQVFSVSLPVNPVKSQSFRFAVPSGPNDKDCILLFDGESYSFNMEWILNMETSASNKWVFCYQNGVSNDHKGSIKPCGHSVCGQIITELGSMKTKGCLSFQEFMYTCLSFVVTKISSACKMMIFPSNVVSKLNTPYFGVTENGNFTIMANTLPVLPGRNIFPIDFNPNESFEITVNRLYAPSISFIQVNNGTLQIFATNSVDLVGEIGQIPKNTCVATYVTDVKKAKVLNVLLKNFKDETYPIRIKTDGNIETLLGLLGLNPCNVGPSIAFANSFPASLAPAFDMVATWLNLQNKSILSLSDLHKLKRFLDQFGVCNQCKKTLANVEGQKLVLLECWDTVCESCFAALPKPAYGARTCPINCDHERTVNPISQYNATMYLDGTTRFRPMEELDRFLESISSDRVFSYTLPYGYDANLEDNVEKVLQGYARTTHEKLAFSWSYADCFYSEEAMKNFSLKCVFNEDYRKLSCIVTKPTFFTVEVAAKFRQIFIDENVVALDVRMVDYASKDYGYMYDVNNTRPWAHYWKDYLTGDFGFAFMIKVPSIEGFGKLISRVRKECQIPWTKNPIHRSSDLAEANQNLNDFFPESHSTVVLHTTKRKFEDEPALSFTDQFFSTLNEVVQNFRYEIDDDEETFKLA